MLKQAETFKTKKQHLFVFISLSFYLILLLLFGNVIAEDSQLMRIDADISLFEIGEDISYLGLEDSRGNLLMINSSTLCPYFIVCSDGMIFTVAFLDNKVRAIFVDNSSTSSDRLFKTPEGVFIGMSYSELLELFPNIELSKMHGWAYETSLSSGWQIGFFTGSTGTDHFPNPDDKINMIFKNKGNSDIFQLSPEWRGAEYNPEVSVNYKFPLATLANSVINF